MRRRIRVVESEEEAHVIASIRFETKQYGMNAIYNYERSPKRQSKIQEQKFNQRAKTAAKIAPKIAPALAWVLVPAAVDGVLLAAEAVADLDTLGPEEGLDTLDPDLEPVELTGTEVNETGLGEGVALKEGVRPPTRNRINKVAIVTKGLRVPAAQPCDWS